MFWTGFLAGIVFTIAGTVLGIIFYYATKRRRK